MRKSGAISAFAMKQVLKAVKPGANLKTLDAIAEEAIVRKGAKPSFMTVPGYKWTTCLTINEEVVHGIPRDIVLKEGDKLSIDLGAVYKGWHTDTAWSLMVGGSKSEFLDCGEKAMWDGISKAVAGNTIGDISNAIQTEIESKGYSVVRTLVGHGVGRQLHEEPEVPGIGERGMGLLLEKGVTLAIESIYAKGDHEVVLANDGWTIVSKDGSLGGLFEMTVVVGDKKPKVLTDWRKV
ncbi:type I methionyl aminopeptidase [Candidatus Daviesbacteria bacterium]|nr:type I methionyl aminopeptidase [Candidatus Daviesbacteria bacterium]